MSGSKPGDAPIERTSVERGRLEAAVAEPSEAAAFRAALATSPIFSQLPEAERESLLETGKVQRVEAGKLVFRSGDPATQVFCVLTGSVTVETADSRAVLNRLGSGEMFGEIGVIEDCCRTASVRAAEVCALLAIDQADFLGLLVSHPGIGVRLVASLARRLNHLTEIVGTCCAAHVTARVA
jgi:CRP/FNR family cyclic AMP-dependent transcriptional regulator